VSLEVAIYSRQRKHRFDMPWLRKAANAAVPHCLKHLKADDAPLATLTEIEVSVVSDAAIGKVHAEFLNDPTPTDVITFHHGEIIVSADTAAHEGPAHGLTLDQELCLYVIHGLMHLAGWDDHDPEEAAEMKAKQEAVLALVTSSDASL
jgi:probable rRNA maturation factor